MIDYRLGKWFHESKWLTPQTFVGRFVMREHTLSPNEIKTIIYEEWRQVVNEAAEIYVKEDEEAKTRSYKIMEFIQLKFVHRLIDFKGDWLSVFELQYTFDLVNTLCASLDNIQTSKSRGTSILNECRN